MPRNWSKANPVDILGDASPGRYKKALEICLQDKNIDSVLVILTPQAMSDPTEVAKTLAKVKNPNKKTILASWMGGKSVQEGRVILENNNIPIYRQPEDAVKSFINVYKHSENIKNLYETPATTPHAFSPDTEANKKIINRAHKNGLTALSEADAKEFLSNYDIPVVSNAIARTSKQASDLAEKIGFPVAMKILSAEILHKTDVGGVKLNVSSKKEAEKAYSEIMTSVRKFEPQAKVDGIFIEGMVEKTYELLIGSKKDNLFGPVIVFGMGGVAVEVFKDTSIALPPLNMALSRQLIEKTKIYKLLRGYRNMPGVDIQSIQFLLYKFAYLLADFPEIKELDINPFAVDENGGIVLDAKVVLDKNVLGKDVKPYSHMVIAPYPREYISSFTLKNGTKVKLRPIKPEDEAMEGEMFKGFSKETQQHRFFKQIGNISHEMLTRYTQIDYDREIAIIAELTKEKEKHMIGVVRLIADPLNNTAEFAVVVADSWQSNELGSKFTEYIIEIAKKRGIKKVYAKFLSDNEIMISIMKKNGFKLSIEKKIGKAELEL